jgi:hypothetical protein
MLEQICDFPYGVVMVCKCGPFSFVSLLNLRVCVLFSVLVRILFMVCVGYLLFFAIVLMIFHSVSFLVCVSGNVVMRVIMCLYAAILCSCGWFDVLYTVVSVVVGFRYMSTSMWSVSLISFRSRKQI